MPKYKLAKYITYDTHATFSSIQDLLDKNIIVEVPADKPMTKTWETLEAGDYVISPTGLKLKIMARLDSTVLTIGPNPNYKQYLMPLVAYDITNLDGFGYTIIQPEPIQRHSTYLRDNGIRVKGSR